MRISDWSSDVCSSDLVNPLQVGALTLQPLFTPGHTDAHHSHLLERPGALRIFTGDALLSDGCGRTDSQNGDAPALYGSVTRSEDSRGGKTFLSTSRIGWSENNKKKNNESSKRKNIC